MGWDFHNELAPYNRRAICRRYVGNGYEVVKDAVVGTTYYAAVKSPHDGSISALIILTRIDRSSWCNFGMKWLGEEDGPFECKCPKSVLDALTPTDNKYALEWREKCWAKINEPQDETLKNAPIGAELVVTTEDGSIWRVKKMAPACQFKSWWLMNVHRWGYIPKSKVIKAELCII